MKIVCVSDTHCQLDKIKIPSGDLLIHSGDLLSRGNLEELKKEIVVLSKIVKNFDMHYFVAGNHDRIFENNPDAALELCKENGINVLMHEAVQYKGLNLFGSPYTPEFGRWAFNVPRGEKLKEKWSQIPDITNILITHGPPYGILDEIPTEYLGYRTNPEKNVGCRDLKDRIGELKELKTHIFGHIHHSYGQKTVNDVKYINASICTEQYKPDNKPTVIEI